VLGWAQMTRRPSLWRWLRRHRAPEAQAAADGTELDVEFYRDWYADMAGRRAEQLNQHWVHCGRREGRYPNLARLLGDKGLDPGYSLDHFDWRVYLARYEDLGSAGLRTRSHALVHYLEHGRGERRSGSFNHEFYTSFYEDLAQFSADPEAAIVHWLTHGRGEGRSATLRDLLEQHGLVGVAMLENFEWSPPVLPAAGGSRSRNWQLLAQALLQEPPGLMPLWGDPVRDAAFYLELAAGHERAGNDAAASQIYLGLIASHPAAAHAGLGNIAARASWSGIRAQRARKQRLARAHFQQALRHDPEALAPRIGIARALSAIEQHADALVAAESTLQTHPWSSDAEAAVIDLAKEFWWSGWSDADCLAAAGERGALFDKAEQLAQRVAAACTQVVHRGNVVPVACSPRRDRVLIVADCQLPQCVRYRIEQKLEQLAAAGYQGRMVSWTEADLALQALAFYDQIIFYRVPSFPQVVRLIATARALGKITFFEIDDLIFVPDYPPPIDTYGGFVGPLEHLGLVKGAALFRAAAALCDFGIASTLPLAERLAALVRRGHCFLHRNALDRLSPVGRLGQPAQGDAVTLFYGSATRAHNSDFIAEALPAITRVLEEHPAARLTVAGFLQLPSAFLQRFGERVALLPMTDDLDTYWDRLASAQINLAVLEPGLITDCKSELKWIEAGLMKIPSVVSPTGNYRDVVRDGEDALLASGPEEWYRALSQLVSEPHTRAAIGEAAHARVLAEYGVANMAANLRSILDAAADAIDGAVATEGGKAG
jgi:hypothetical protein